MFPEYIAEERVIRFDTFGLDIVSLLQGILGFLFGADGTHTSMFDGVAYWWGIYSITALLFAALFFVGFIYAKIKWAQLASVVQRGLLDAEAAWAHAHGSAAGTNTRWVGIESQVTTDNPNDWRHAIIEADIMLEDVLVDAGYTGTTLGERLKSASAQPFNTLNDAWEAHKVRNHIAHAGSDFVLTQKKAQDTITQYGRVFREFGVI